MKLKKDSSRSKRKLRIRKKVSGTESRPRVTVYRSNAHIYVQAVDDITGVTIASGNDKDTSKGTNVEKAEKVGASVGKALKSKNIKHVVFDRNGYKYHGRVKAVADGIRESGVEV